MESVTEDRELVLEVHSPLGAHSYKAWSDGSTEGFPDGALVVNHVLPRQQRRAGLLRQLVLGGRLTDQEAASLL